MLSSRQMAPLRGDKDTKESICGIHDGTFDMCLVDKQGHLSMYVGSMCLVVLLGLGCPSTPTLSGFGYSLTSNKVEEGEGSKDNLGSSNCLN